MEKIKARYLAPLEETASKVASIQTKDLAFAYTTLSEAEEKSFKAEMEQYLLMASCCAEYEYDDDEDEDEGEDDGDDDDDDDEDEDGEDDYKPLFSSSDDEEEDE